MTATLPEYTENNEMNLIDRTTYHWMFNGDVSAQVENLVHSTSDK